MRFIEVVNLKNQIEIVNPEHITKFFEHGEVTRLNLVDGTFVLTEAHIDDMWASITEGE